MDVSRFELDAPGQQRAINSLKCGLCQNIFINPHTCQSNHPFCESCILRHLDHADTCPIDNAPLTKHDIRYSSMYDDMLAIFTIRCGNERDARSSIMPMLHRSACPWKGSVSDVKSHELDCPYRKQQCDKCGEAFLSVYVRAHELHCPKRSVECDLCGTSVRNQDMKSHYDSCPESSVYCPNHCLVELDSGQATILRRKDVAAHLSICLNRVQDCEFTPFGCKFRGTTEALKLHVNSSVCDHLSFIARSQTSILRTLKSVESKLSSLSEVSAPERRQRSPSPTQRAIAKSSLTSTPRLTRKNKWRYMLSKESSESGNIGYAFGKHSRSDDDREEYEGGGDRRKRRNSSNADKIKSVGSAKSISVSDKPPDNER